MTLSNLNKSIIHCRKCERLVNFREKIAKEKRKQYIDQSYWGNIKLDLQTNQIQ